VSNISTNLEGERPWCLVYKQSETFRKVQKGCSQGLTSTWYFKINLASMLVFLYKMYVCPQMEYCVQVWNPFLAKDIDLLEKVQRRATKCLHSLSNLSYEEWLGRLDLYSLFCRRQRGGLIEVFKILNRYYDIKPTVFFTINNSSTPKDISSSCSRSTLDC